MLRLRTGIILLALLLVGTSLAGGFIHPATANADNIPIGGGGGGGTAIPGINGLAIDAQFIDSNHIGVTIVGTPTTGIYDGDEVDFSNLQGIYASATDISMFPLLQQVGGGADANTARVVSNGVNYGLNGSIGAAAQGCGTTPHFNISSVNLQTGDITATFYPELSSLSSSASTAQAGQCVNQAIPNVTITDNLLGGTAEPYNYYSYEACGLGNCLFWTPGSGVDTQSIPGYASAVMFYEANGGQNVIATSYDSNVGTNGKPDFFTFRSLGANTNSGGVKGGTLYVNSIANAARADALYQSGCLDRIVLPSNPETDDGVFQATYLQCAHDPSAQYTAAKAATWKEFPVLVSDVTPEAEFATLSGGGATDDTDTVGQAPSPDTCPISSWALRWLVCPVLDAIQTMVSPLNKLLDNWLSFPTAYFNTGESPGQSFFNAWSDFRDIAVSLLVIAALVMVIGESAGFDLLDAYSIRKILPRLLTGAIAMTLSWVLCTFIIQLFNNLDNWLPDIILYPFHGLYANGATLTPTGVLGTVQDAGGAALAGVAVIAGAVGAVEVFGVLAILSLILSLIISLLVAFVTLTIRTTIIILWLITSPLGIACYILPTTQRGFHFWRDAGVSAFVAGLAIVTFISAGQLMAILFVTAKGAVPILAPVAIVVSYMSIGTAFRVAGGLIGNAAGAVHGFHSGSLSKLKDFRHSQPSKRWQAAQAGSLHKGWVGKKLNDRVQRIALMPKALSERGITQAPKVWSQIKSDQKSAHEDHAAHLKEKGEHFAKYAGNDVFNWAIMRSTGAGLAKFEQELREKMGDTAFKNKFGDKLSAKDAVEESLKMDGLKKSDKNSDTQNKQIAASRKLMYNRVMTAKHVHADSEALLMAATEAQAATGTAFKNSELTDEAKMTAYKTAFYLDKNGKKIKTHVEGRDFHEEEETDEDGNVTGSKLVIHDATGKMYDWINTATEDDRDAAINMFARMRGAANQSGRVDLGGASFGAGVTEINKLYATGHDIEESTVSHAEKERRLQDARTSATDAALLSVATGNDQAMLSGGKPYGAEAIGRRQYQLINERAKKLQDLTTVLGGSPEEIAMAERNLKQAAVGAAGIWDSMGARSQENYGKLSTELMGKKIAGMKKKIRQADGSEIVSNEDMTVVEYYAQLANSRDPVVTQSRREFGVNDENALALQNAQQNASNPTTTTPTPPGTTP